LESFEGVENAVSKLSTFEAPETLFEKAYIWRMESYGPNWHVNGATVNDGIRIKAEKSCWIYGFGQYYSSCGRPIKATLDVELTTQEDHVTTSLFQEDLFIKAIPLLFKDTGELAYSVLFKKPIRIQPKQELTISVTYHEPDGSKATIYCGHKGRLLLEGKIRISPLQMIAPYKNLSEDATIGQFPYIIFVQ
jgi:hypothetical protein